MKSGARSALRLAKRGGRVVARKKAKRKLKSLLSAFRPLIDAATGQPFGQRDKNFEKKHRAGVLKLKDRLTPAERKELLKLAPRPADTRWPSEIRIGKRFRKEFRNLDAVARSIESLVAAGKPGLLQPIGITPKDEELIWGERRLKAWKQSAVALTHPVPVRVYDIGAIIVGEYIENDPKLRENFTIEEAVDIVRAMTAKQRTLAAAEAAARPRETRAAPGRAAKPGATPGRVADRAAAFVGRSRPTIAKGAALVDAAAEDPQKFGKLLDQANRTGRVDGPFKRLQVMKATDAMRAAPPAMPANDLLYAAAAIDYPWPHEPEMEQEEIDAAGRSTRPYPAMSIKAGCHFMREVLAPRLAKKCTVYFWTTGFHMPYAYQLLAALGFTKSCLIGVWAKDKIGRGRVLRDQTEFCIVMHRGAALIALTDDTTLWQGPGWETRENSRKPEAFYRLVERKSPAQRYLSVFSTGGEGELWDAYGDQAAKHAEPAAAELPDQAELAKTRTLLDRLRLIEAGDGLLLMSDEVDELLREKLVKGKGALKLNVAGTKHLAELELAADRATWRRTPPGEPIVPDIIKPGMTVTTSYDTGPYVVLEVTGPWFDDGHGGADKKREFPTFSLNLARPDDKKPKKGAQKPTAWINELVAVGGRIFGCHDDEIFVAGALDQAAIEEFENADLYRMPADVIAAIVAVGGHTISRTIDWDAGEKGYSVATCQCGWSARADRTLPYSGENVIVPQEEQHWREMLQWSPAPAGLTTAAATPELPLGSGEIPELPPFLDRRTPKDAAPITGADTRTPAGGQSGTSPGA